MFAALRLAVGCASALGLAACVAWGYSLAQGPPTPIEVGDRAVRATFRGDPDSEAALRAAAGSKLLAALAASADPADRDARLTRAAAAARRGKPDAELTLLRHALDSPEAEREGLLVAHGEAASALAEFPETQAGYLGALGRALGSAESRELAADDPLGLAVSEAVADDDLKRFYLRHRDWLAEPLAQLDPGEGAAGLADALRAARDCHPLARQAVCECRLGYPGLALLTRHGRLVSRAVDHHKLPLGEVLGAVFTNSADLESDSPEAGAGRLGAARDQGREVWAAVRATPLSLRLLKDAGPDGAACLRTHAADDIAGILYLQFPKLVPQAAQAVARFGDRALLVLRQYGGSGPDSPSRERFDKLLAAHGWRVVPMLSERGMKGMDELEANPRAYDKFFDEAGNPKDKEWWARVPIVGAPADLARNVAQGRPVELEELGWAALDVADAAAIAVTLGGAAPAVAAKQAVKVGVKQGVKREARREAIRAGAGGLARRVASEPLTLALRAGKLLVSAGASGFRTAAQKLTAASSRLSALERGLAVRAFLGVGVYAAYKRLPPEALSQLAAWAARRAEELAKGAAELVGRQLIRGLEAVIGPLPAGSWRRFAGPAGGGAVCLAGAAWGIWPLARRGRRDGGK